MRKRYKKRTKNEVKCFQISSFYDLSLDSRRTALKETGKFCNVSGNDAAMDMIRKNRYKYKDKADTYLPMKIGGFPNLINIDNTDHISIFQYGNKEIKAENKDIYDQVKVDKQYNVKIEITTYKDGTKDYDVMKIISEIKEK